MHDWLLLNLIVSWERGSIIIELKDASSQIRCITVNEFCSIQIPRNQEWGESSSVNSVEFTDKLENGNSIISINMQSGDQIIIEGRSISIPSDLESN